KCPILRGMHKAIKPAKKIAVFVAGVTVIIVGIALLILPGPGWLLIFIGLLILATEFEWAAKHRDNVKGKMEDVKRYAKKRTAERTAPGSGSTNSRGSSRKRASNRK